MAPGPTAPPPAAPVVFCGAATLDTIAEVEALPGPDERVVAGEVTVAGGGPAATAAVAHARLGLPAAFVGVVGDDEEGERVRAGLAAEGVDTTGLARVPGRTQVSVILVEAARATRSICTRPGPALTAATTAGARGLVEAAAWVHVDHAGWAAARSLLRGPGGRSGRYAQQPARALVSVDAGNPVPGLALDEVDLYVPTDAALRRRYGDRPEEQLLAAALADGARTVVATRGARGSCAATAGGARAEVPAARVDRLRSTLGAGDVYHGALLAAVVRGEALHRCLAYAGAAAALSCRGLDGRSAIPSHHQVLALLEEQAAPSATPTHRAPLEAS